MHFSALEIQKKILSAFLRKKEKNKEKSSFITDALKMASVFAEKCKKTVDICIKLIYILSYKEIGGTALRSAFFLLIRASMIFMQGKGFIHGN